MAEYILEMNGITKTFPGVKALDNVNLKVKKGEIHALEVTKVTSFTMEKFVNLRKLKTVRKKVL